MASGFKNSSLKVIVVGVNDCTSHVKLRDEALKSGSRSLSKAGTIERSNTLELRHLRSHISSDERLNFVYVSQLIVPLKVTVT